MHFHKLSIPPHFKILIIKTTTKICDSYETTLSFSAMN